jgi:hypothetical protein
LFDLLGLASLHGLEKRDKRTRVAEGLAAAGADVLDGAAQVILARGRLACLWFPDADHVRLDHL